MTTKQQNFVDMGNTSYNKLIAHKPLWENIPEFSNLVEVELNTTLSDLAITDKEAMMVITGSAADKASARKQAIAAALAISGPIAVYALNTNNLTLFEQTNFTKSKLRKMQDGSLANCLSGIIETAETLGEKVIPFGVTPERLADAKAKTEEYAQQVNTPRAMITRRSTKLNTVADYIDALRDILSRIDKMMLLFQDTEFYTEYKNARKIVDLGTRKKTTTTHNAETPKE